MLLFLFDSLSLASVLKYWSGNFNLNLLATAATIMFIIVFDWLSMIPLSWFILSGLYLFCHFYLGNSLCNQSHRFFSDLSALCSAMADKSPECFDMYLFAVLLS